MLSSSTEFLNAMIPGSLPPRTGPIRREAAPLTTPALRDALSNVVAGSESYSGNVRGSNERLEIEISLGVITGGQFHPGVRHRDYQAIETYCTTQQHVRPVQTESTEDYWYEDFNPILVEHGAVSKAPICTTNPHPVSRLHLAASNNLITACQVKTPCEVQNFRSPASFDKVYYDTQVHINYEQNLPFLVGKLGAVPSNPTCKRVKTRKRFRLKPVPNWIICLTLVLHGQEDPIVVYEVEFSLVTDSIDYTAAPQLQRSQLATCTQQLWDEFLPLITVGQRSRQFGPSTVLPIIHDQMVATPVATTQVMMACSTTAARSIAGRRAFCGVIPKRLTRSALADLHATAETSFVADQTEGVRMYLVLLPKDNVYSVERDATVRVWPALSGLLRPECGLTRIGTTVLDGELIEDYKRPGKYTYILFKVLRFDGKLQIPNLSQLPEFVAANLTRPFSSANMPFKLVARQYYPLLQLRELTTRLEADTTSGKRLVRYPDNSYFVSTGLIFISSDGTVWKWSPPQHVTTVFSLSAPLANGSAQLLIGNAENGTNSLLVGSLQISPSEQVAMHQISLDSELCNRWQGQTLWPRTPLAECWYDGENEKWVLYRFRTDRRHPDLATDLMARLCYLTKPIPLSGLYKP